MSDFGDRVGCDGDDEVDACEWVDLVGAFEHVLDGRGRRGVRGRYKAAGGEETIS